MIKLERILCPIDLSPESAEALPYAIALAKSQQATLCLLHCVESPTRVDGPGPEELRASLEGLIRPHWDINAETIRCAIHIAEGEPVRAIARAAGEEQADLIVMSSRRRPMAAALLGSTTEAVYRTAPCPVLVIHQHEREWIEPVSLEINLRRILIAHDFSSDSDMALAFGLSLAQEYQAELHLLHVLPPGHLAVPPEMPADESEEFQQAAQRLQSAIPAEVFLWCKVKQAVRSGHPHREILAYAEEQGIDLICVGLRGAGLVIRDLFGSNTDRVLRHAPCPVLIVRPLDSTEPLPAIDASEPNLAFL